MTKAIKRKIIYYVLAITIFVAPYYLFDVRGSGLGGIGLLFIIPFFWILTVIFLVLALMQKYKDEEVMEIKRRKISPLLLLILGTVLILISYFDLGSFVYQNAFLFHQFYQFYVTGFGILILVWAIVDYIRK